MRGAGSIALATRPSRLPEINYSGNAAVYLAGFSAPLSHNSALRESEQIGVQPIFVRRSQALRSAGVDFERRVTSPPPVE